MKKELLIFALCVSLIVSVASVARADLGVDGRPALEWRIITYFGLEALADLDWYWQWTVATGVGVGCGFIGLGVGMLNPFAGFFVSTGCDAGLMA
jgi:hypothetical protein